ncbi:MAG TPA: FAD-containing oxidoreductase [Planctomycetaceae bacterium]|nr:FAD-containing oxidoreductase [Planctomycetaceae bacterium]
MNDSPSQAPFAPLLPFDEYNQKLEQNVHPADWVNPEPTKPYHLVVLGAGTSGLVTAAAAAGLGARVALIERELMGGDCLNVGCVPSKGMIHAARVAASLKEARAFGFTENNNAPLDFELVMQRMRRLRAEISPNDSAERFQKLGVDVFFGQASFVDEASIMVTRSDGQEQRLNYRKAVIATGARATAPEIPGLDTVHYLTNETLYSLTKSPATLGVIGSGPVGCEMAQAFARLGSQVFLFERSSRLLSKEDPCAAEILEQQFVKDGIEMIFNSQDLQIEKTSDEKIRVQVTQAGKVRTEVVEQLLVAVGRAPNVEDLNLESVGVEFDKSGVKVNDHLQTTNPKIFAAGDICSKYKFTHIADFQARIVIQNALFALGPFGKKKASDLIVPWATYTSPEVAHVGLSETDAERAEIEIDTYTQELAEVDRAILEGQDAGFVKVHTKKGSDQILGATIVANNAGDLISEITLAMNNHIGLSKIASAIHPYPTQAEAIRKLGDQFNRTKLTEFNKKILDLLRWLNVGG